MCYISCQLRMLSMKWWFVTARETAHRKSVAANHITWLVLGGLIYVCATTRVKMTTMFTLMMIQIGLFSDDSSYDELLTGI